MTTRVNDDGVLVNETVTDSIVLLEANGETVYNMADYGLDATAQPSAVINTMADAIMEDKGIDISTGYTARLSGTNFYVLAKPVQG